MGKNKNSNRAAAKIATGMVGSSCFHAGEHGEIIRADTESYDVPMVYVRFGDRIAILTPSEIGAR
jgi:hypothetical protein